MPELLSGLLSGFQVTFDPLNLLFCFAGVFIGTLIGVLPGIGPIGAMSILLPMTFGLSPVSSLIMLAGIYYGAQYGGSTTSILVNIPGEAASIVTCLDGYQMARQGRAGPALGMAAFGSLIGSTFSIFVLMFSVITLARVALKFGPPEYFSLICLSLLVSIYLAKGSFAKSLIMIIVGLLLGCVGIDQVSGSPRFTFGSPSLYDGIGVSQLAMGLFGIAEVFGNLEESLDRVVFKTRVRNLLPNLEDWKRSAGPISRGAVLGFPLGVLPGGGAVLASFLSYALEKRISKNPEKFGTGAIEGVAGPETANNAGAGGAFVPLLALGIPPNAVMALLLGALIVHGVTPGPTFITKHPDLFWGVIASMYVGNVMLLVLNLPLIGLWVKLLKVPYRIMMPLILVFCLIGAYSINNNVVDVLLMVLFGVAGYLLRKSRYDTAPLVLSFILGPLLETAFKQSLIMSDGSLLIFTQRPISAVTLTIAALLLISTAFSYYRKTKANVALGRS